MTEFAWVQILMLSLTTEEWSQTSPINSLSPTFFIFKIGGNNCNYFLGLLWLVKKITHIKQSVGFIPILCWCELLDLCGLESLIWPFPPLSSSILLPLYVLCCSHCEPLFLEYLHFYSPVCLCIYHTWGIEQLSLRFFVCFNYYHCEYHISEIFPLGRRLSLHPTPILV